MWWNRKRKRREQEYQEAVQEAQGRRDKAVSRAEAVRDRTVERARSEGSQVDVRCVTATDDCRREIVQADRELQVALATARRQRGDGFVGGLGQR